MTKKSTIDASEIESFNEIANGWWDENGKFKPLHKLNPTRISYLKSMIEDNYDDIKDLNILDIGCGGGLVSEPLCRLGAKVTGIDAGDKTIAIAKAHAEKMGLKINYQQISAEELAEKKKKFDVVNALEIVEHVADVNLFVKSCADLVKKDGILIMSTLNRTPKSYALGIVAAEYILRWLPKGTHDWKKFLKPSELVNIAEEHGLKAIDVTGIKYNPLSRKFSLDKKDLDVNYFLAFKKG